MLIASIFLVSVKLNNITDRMDYLVIISIIKIRINPQTIRVGAPKNLRIFECLKKRKHKTVKQLTAKKLHFSICSHDRIELVTSYILILAVTNSSNTKLWTPKSIVPKNHRKKSALWKAHHSHCHDKPS